jgi:hypothetical protein
MNSNRVSVALALVIAMAIFVIAGCGAMQPPDTEGPRANAPAYPPVMKEDPPRRDATINAVYQVLAPQGSIAEVALQPVTATIQSLPAESVLLYLPKVGTEATMTEDETRESLRRFIEEWRHIIGAEPNQLSLVRRTDQPDGRKLAVFEQRPFRYPLRGNYGKVEIWFNAERRILELTSTCIPDAERFQTSLAGVAPVLKPEDAVKFVKENALTYTDSKGQRHTSSLSPNAAAEAGELVFYVKPGEPDTLEFHLAWEVRISNSGFKAVYVDAVKAQILAIE